jgi:hypothetical protein
MGLMPVPYHIDREAGMLFVFADGMITQAERIGAMRAWMSDPAYRPGLKTMCDFSAAISVPTREDLMQIVSFMEEQTRRIGRKKLALVTPMPLATAVARQFRALTACGPLEVGVFRTRHEARAWLHQAGD